MQPDTQRHPQGQSAAPSAHSPHADRRRSENEPQVQTKQVDGGDPFDGTSTPDGDDNIPYEILPCDDTEANGTSQHYEVMGGMAGGETYYSLMGGDGDDGNDTNEMYMNLQDEEDDHMGSTGRPVEAPFPYFPPPPSSEEYGEGGDEIYDVPPDATGNDDDCAEEKCRYANYNQRIGEGRQIEEQFRNSWPGAAETNPVDAEPIYMNTNGQEAMAKASTLALPGNGLKAGIEDGVRRVQSWQPQGSEFSKKTAREPSSALASKDSGTSMKPEATDGNRRVAAPRKPPPKVGKPETSAVPQARPRPGTRARPGARPEAKRRSGVPEPSATQECEPVYGNISTTQSVAPEQRTDEGNFTSDHTHDGEPFYVNRASYIDFRDKN